jgi:SAM-dependent methyltransferase
MNVTTAFRSGHWRANQPAIMDVQAFYERYPYPPPASDLDSYRRRWADPQRRRADFHLAWPTRPYREDFSILIAGCGTAQAAKYALRWPQARVIGIDFAATSLQHTVELKHKYRLHNLELHQLPLEKVEDLRTRFDQIACTGVLHHLPDPKSGLSALRDVLEPDGAIHLMVYAPHGRSGIYLLQEFFRRVGFQAPDADIGDVLAVLKALPPTHPLMSLLREAPDFRTEAALADALLNPQDRAYSVPQLFDLLHTSRLVFGRWVRQAPYCLQVGLPSRMPEAMRDAPIPPEDQYAAAELFRGTLMRHSVIAYRNDHPSLPEITFAGDAWRGYVPIRSPDTICVEEELPPGVAGVLINRTHAHTDICLPLRANEKLIFEAIDGKRPICAFLSEQVGNDAVRSLFERLWWHDQVVFDASALPQASA